MTQQQATYSVFSWGPRYKAQIRVDGNDTEHEFFDSYREATKWARRKVKQATQQAKN